ncbi:MAG: MarR family transcriptional regulator [Natronospirillum sp.]
MLNTDANLLISLNQTVGKIQKQLSGPLSMHGIGFTEYLVLRYLDQSPDKKLRRIDLADKVGLTASGVTRLLNPMQKVGLVAKEEALRDARVSLVALTAAGERIFQESDATFSAVAERVLSALDSQAKNALAETVDKLS